MSLTPPAPSKLVPGYRLDRYELLCPIAEGGMAQVWVARMRGKHGFAKLVAIKTILPKYAAEPQFQQMFLDEARIASGIEHTNVAQIFDLGEEHDVLFLAMEWVDGDALTKIHRAVEKKGMKIPIGVLLRVLADTCGGLHAAHELHGPDGELLGVVHRDVSPQNILVSSRGVAKLIDFGIAKARDRLAGDTNTGFLKGKVQYMAPEQALGRKLDRRADLWAIGAILYHYLAGAPPFDGPNQLATLHLLTEGKPPAPLPKEVPAPVAEIVKRALAHNLDHRFATAAEMQAAIEQAMLASGLSTTIADVAAFAVQHVADRAQNRREAVDLALKAAAERERMQALLKPTDADSSGSISEAGAKIARVVLSPPKPPPAPAHAASAPQRESIKTVALAPQGHAPDAAPPSPHLIGEAKLPPPPSVPTNASLLQAVVETPAPTPMKRTGMVAIAIVGALGIALGVGVTIALSSGGDTPKSAAASVGGSAAATQTLASAPKPAFPPPPLPSSDPAPSASASATPSAAAPPRAAAPASPAPSPAKPAKPTTSPAAKQKIPQVIDNGF